MPDNLGFYLWLLLMLFITGLLGSLTLLIWRSERRGHYRPKPPTNATSRQPEGKPASTEEG
jgi:hypothetical protein